MFTLPQEIFMNFEATIRIASFVVSRQFTLPQSTISLRWSVVAFITYVNCRATKFCLECGSWFVTVYMSFGHSTQLAKYFFCIISGAWH